jgi:autotransporter-associated beta strand protein
MSHAVDSVRRRHRIINAKRAAVMSAAAVVAFGLSHRAGASTWTDPAAVDPGVTTAGNANNLFTSTTAVKDGDVIKVGGTTAGGLQTLNNYYVVGVGNTGTTTTFKLTNFAPSNGLISAATAGSPASTLVQQWFNAADWSGGVPNAVDATATFGTAGTPITNTIEASLNGNATVGALNFVGAGNMSLISTIIGNSGPFSTLTFATSAGTPTITQSGGGSFMLSDCDTTSGTANRGVGNAIGANTGGLVNGRLTIAGTQGLTIDNQNAIGTVTTFNSASTPGAFRFGYQLDWSKFSGVLTLKEGAFALDGVNAANNTSNLPMNTEVVLGTGTTSATRAQLELCGNQGTTYIRGLTSSNPFSTIVNPDSQGGPPITLGSYSQPGETYTYNGTMGGSNVYSGTTATQVTARVRIVKEGSSTQILNGNMTIQGGALMSVNGGTLSLGTKGAVGTSFDVNGQGTSIYGTPAPGTPAGASPAINDANNIWIHNGELKMDGTGLSYARSQTFGCLIPGNGGDAATTGGGSFANSSNGLDTISLVADPSQPITMTFAGIRTRNEYGVAVANGNANGVTYLFRGTNLGTSAPNTAGNANLIFTNVWVAPGSAGTLNGTNAPTLAPTASGLGVTGTAGTTNYGVIKGALADTSATGGGAGFATYDPTNGVRLLAASEQDTSGYPAASNTSLNTRLNLAGVGAAITGVTTQTLQIDNTNGGATAATVTNSGAGLYATQGILLSGNAPITLTGGTITGAASASNNEDVVIHSINSAGVTIATAVSNPGATGGFSGWITYNGSGNFNITGAQTTGNSGGIAFNGTGTTLLNAACSGVSNFALNQGTVQLGSSFTINTGVNLQVASGTTLDLNGLSPIFNALNVNTLYQNAGSNTGGGVIKNTSSTASTLIIGGAGTAPNCFTGSIQGGGGLGTINLQVGRVGGTALTLALEGINSYTGTTTVLNGSTLSIIRYGQLPIGTTVTLGDATNTAGTLSLGADIQANGTATTTLANAGVNQEIAGLFTAGTATTSAVIGNNLNPSTLTVNYNGGSPDTFGGVLGTSAAGVGNNLVLRKTGTGTLTLTGAGANFYTGGTIVEGGTLSIARDNQLGGIGAIAPGTAAAPSPTFAITNNVNLNGGTLQVTGTFTLGDAFSATTPAVPNRRIIGLGPTQGATGGTGTIEVTSTNVLTDAAPITTAGNTGTDNLTKTGTGTLNLTGASTYNGTTTVQLGKLLVNGSILGTAVNVLNGGLLGGSGVVGGTSTVVTVSGGGTASPGNSIGTLTIGTGGTGNPVTFAGTPGLNAMFAAELDGSGTNASDLLAVNGSIDLSTVFDELDLSLVGGATPTGTYTIASYTGTLNGIFDNVNGLPAGYGVVYSNPGLIQVAPVPEPVGLGMLALGATALLGRRRRRSVR